MCRVPSRLGTGLTRLKHLLMAKPPKPGTTSFGVRERMLLFCVASGTDWKQAGIMSETVMALIVRGLLVRDSLGRLALTGDGRAALRALLPE